jgi:hypothetical protein
MKKELLYLLIYKQNISLASSLLSLKSLFSRKHNQNHTPYRGQKEITKKSLKISVIKPGPARQVDPVVGPVRV